MRAFTRSPLLIRILVCLIAPIPVASCLAIKGTATFPPDWAPVKYHHEDDLCPNLAGVYDDRGELPHATTSGRPCVSDASECESLIFSLLFDAHLDLRQRGVKRDRVDLVHIQQLSPGVLEIVGDPGGNRQILSLADGDYTCDESGLRLAEKTTGMVLLVSNVISREIRVFNTAEDGSLIMKAEWRNTGHHTFVPFDTKSEGWVRWKRVTVSELDNGISVP